ncbi:MAG: immunoglobulin-like domain-containing protein [Pseudomonadota bacterium]
MNTTDCAAISEATIGGSVNIPLSASGSFSSFSVTYNGVTFSGLPQANLNLPNIVGDAGSVLITALGSGSDAITCDLDYAAPACVAATQSPDSSVTPVDVGTVLTLEAETAGATNVTISGTPMTPDADPDTSNGVTWEASLTAVSAQTVTANLTGPDGDTANCQWTVAINDEPPTVTAPDDITVEATGVLTAVSLGTATVDDDNDFPTATPDETGPFPVGMTTVTWSATDSSDQTGQDTQIVTVTDTTPPTIGLIGDSPLVIAFGSVFSDPGATAVDLVDGNVTGDITTTDNVDVNQVANYLVTYEVEDRRGNRASRTRTVQVRDQSAPVVTAPDDIILEATGPTTDVDLGLATVVDDVDGELDAVADMTGPFALGTTTVTWSATDSAENTGSDTQDVTVVDTTAPAITLLGNDPLILTVGTPFEDPGATALDLVDLDRTEDIAVSGEVDSDTTGMYTLTYTVADLSGNEAVATRTVQVTFSATVDLSVTKDDGLAVAESGTLVDYIIVVRNSSIEDAVGIGVSDIIPAGLSGVSWICDAEGAAGCTAEGTGDVIDTVDLPGETSVIYTVTGTIEGADGTVIENTVSLTIPDDVLDANADDDSATDRTRVGERVFIDGFENPGDDLDAVLAKLLQAPWAPVRLASGDDELRLHVRHGYRLESRISRRDSSGRWQPGAWQPLGENVMPPRAEIR